MSIDILTKLMPTLANAADPDYCTQSETSFASCQSMSPSYEAVVLAVHGWNGSCGGTFGRDDESIFRVLGGDRTHFFDFDCFEYDSLNTPIEENVRNLHARMVALHQRGYQHAMLITHSTGGVIALQVLTDAVLDDRGYVRSDLEREVVLADDGIRIPAVQAWATPISGLKRTVRFGGRVLSVFGYSPETLPDLEPNSTFLTNLRRRALTRFPDRGRTDRRADRSG